MKTRTNETNNATHTPGPWKHNETWGLITYGKQEIAALHSGNVANARLISAAPELLEALKALLPITARVIQVTTDGQPILRQARAAIAKATGGEQ
jgi:hypothetical protein